MKYIRIIILHILAILPAYSSSDVCPTKVVQYDEFKIRDKFEKIKNDVGNRLKVEGHVHKEHHSEKYDYTITFCGPDGDVAVLQEKPGDKEYMKIVGKHSDHSFLLGGEDWLFLQYYDGERYHNKTNGHCSGKKRQAWISIRCEDQGEAPKLTVVEEGRFQSGTMHSDTPCYYMFEFNHKYACTDKILAKLDGKTSKTGKGLSGGAVFMIVILSLFLAYLLFGFLYQRFVAGAKGMEQIPNYSFWKKLGNLSADGCDFVCRREEHPNTYKGMADALDIDSSEDEDRDDGLLPM